MHDLIEEMGKDIVHQESPNEPGERSRVWSEEDVDHVLTNNTGTSKVSGIQVSWWRSSPTSLNAKSFSKMKNLRYISMSRGLKYECIFGDIGYISNQLRWLDWPNCPLQSFPSNFHANKLVELNIRGSREIRQLWQGHKNFARLTCMNLSGCESLIELPDFCGIPNLKELELFKCISLVKVPDSIRFLHNLVTLNVDDCSNLITFPKKINLKSVETISIMCCKLEEFSEVGEEMGSLRTLYLSGTCIRKLPPSITKLIRLEQLWLDKCQNLTFLPYNIYELRNVKDLNASNCPKLATFPEIPIKMDSLRFLNLPNSDIRELDESIGNLIGLEWLDLSNCKNLTTLPCSIYRLQNLKVLDLVQCSKLVRFPTNTNILNVDGCSLSLPKLWRLDIGGCSLLSDCDFLMTLDCWETLDFLDLSRNNFVSLPACITKFVNLRRLDLRGCKRLREIPELPPDVEIYTGGCEDDCESLDTEETSPSTEDDDEEEPTPSSRLSLSSEPLKRDHSPEEPSTVIPPKRQRAAEQASMVHFAHEMAISPIPMIPDMHSSHHSTTHIDESGMLDWLSWLSSANAEQKRPRNGANEDYDHQQEQQEQPIPSKRHCTEEQPSMPPFLDYFASSSSSASTCDMWWSPLAQIFQTSNWQANLDPLPNSQSTLANLQSTSPSTPEFQQ